MQYSPGGVKGSIQRCRGWIVGSGTRLHHRAGRTKIGVLSGGRCGPCGTSEFADPFGSGEDPWRSPMLFSRVLNATGLYHIPVCEGLRRPSCTFAKGARKLAWDRVPTEMIHLGLPVTLPHCLPTEAGRRLRLQRVSKVPNHGPSAHLLLARFMSTTFGGVGGQHSVQNQVSR
jgi:hypothetical protein